MYGIPLFRFCYSVSLCLPLIYYLSLSVSLTYTTVYMLHCSYWKSGTETKSFLLLMSRIPDLWLYAARRIILYNTYAALCVYTKIETRKTKRKILAPANSSDTFVLNNLWIWTAEPLYISCLAMYGLVEDLPVTTCGYRGCQIIIWKIISGKRFSRHTAFIKKYILLKWCLCVRVFSFI